MGKMQRTKGAVAERELVHYFNGRGLFAERVPLSGATSYAKSDVDLYVSSKKGIDSPDYIIESKRRKNLPAWILKGFKDGCDIVCMREDRGRWYVVEALDVWAKRVQEHER